MKLAKLLEYHQQSGEASALSDNLGDGYLLRSSAIFRAIREETLKAGFTFDNQKNDFYQALPLSQLENIFTEKKIPYLDNVSVLRQLESKVPKTAEWSEIGQNLKRNFIFHESCHVVARSYAGSLTDDNKLLRMLMEEAFANTCELLAMLDVQEAAGKIFYEVNSYTALFESRSLLNSAMQDIGNETFFKFVFLGYLHSNFLFEKLEEHPFNRILKLIGHTPALDMRQLKTLRAHMKICFTLDVNFKLLTTQFYMKLSGLALDTKAINSFDYLAVLEKNEAYRTYLTKLAQVAKGIK